MTEFRPSEVPEKLPKDKFLWLKITIPTLAVLVATVCILASLFGQGAACDKEYDGIYEKVTESEDYFTELKGENEDFIGFLYFGESGLPVVKTDKEKVEHYSEHLFLGSQNKYGTPYTKSEITDDSKITVVTANGFSDGRMFDFIKDFQKDEESSEIVFETHTGKLQYLPFAAFSYEGEEPFLIDRLSFLNDKVFLEYIGSMRSFSKRDFIADSDVSDKLLVLVSKEKNQTHILALRALREGEDPLNPEKYTVPTNAPVASAGKQDENGEEEKTQEKNPQNEKEEAAKEENSSIEAQPSDIDDDTEVSEEGTYETGKYEQTGLTQDLDKTVKVEVNNVVTMLNVVGMSKSSAKNVVKNTLGLPVKIVEQENEAERGTVFSQSVAVNAEVSTDVTVTLYVSLGITSGYAVVPDLVGNAVTNAEIVLNKYNLRYDEKNIVYKESSLEKGTILAQSLEAGSEVKVNTKVSVTVSDGSIEFKTVKMPDITGKSKEKAKAAIKAAGLKVGSIKTVASSKSAGTVVSQEVPEGEKIEEGATVGFSVSNGSKVNNLTVTNISSWSVKINGKSYPSGAVIKGDYMDIIPYIVEAEMGSGFESEALKAQAVAAYCWLINAGSKKGAAPGVPMKNPSQKAIDAARAVSGVQLKYGGEVAQTYYYAISAGYTANCKDVWFADLAYLRAVESPGCKNYSGYKTKVTYTASQMKKMIESTYDISLSGVNKSKWLSVKYDENGAYARSVSVGGKITVNGSSIREKLCDYELRSTAFKVSYSKSTDKFTFTVYGYGHGIGMSQVGANYYAELGWNYEQILLHYYPGTKLG